MDVVSIAVRLVGRVVRAASGAKRNKKWAARLAQRVGAFEAVLQGLAARALTSRQQQGVNLLVRALEDAVALLEKIDKRNWFSAKARSKADHEALEDITRSVSEASDLLQVGLQISQADDIADMREDMMALVQEQGDALSRQMQELKEQQRAQWGSANEHASLTRDHMDKIKDELIAALGQMALQARKDPSATAADLGVRAKVALVVGVADYEGMPLSNPVNDARDVASALRMCDFDVELALDATLDDFEGAQERFEERLAPGTLAVFYFAGHGLEHAGENYLLMRDAAHNMDEKKVQQRKSKAIRVREVIQGMENEECAFQLIILDACRTAPVKRLGRNASLKGLARMEVPALKDGGCIVAFATAAGEEAKDKVDEEGDGRNGLYTRHLLEHIRRPMPISNMLLEVQWGVEEASDDKQKPWINQHISRKVSKLQLVDGTEGGGERPGLRRMSSRTERLRGELQREKEEKQALEARLEQAEAERAAAEEREARRGREAVSKREAPDDFSHIPSWMRGGTEEEEETREATQTRFDNQTLREAVALWVTDEAAAVKTYGDIAHWDTSRVTSMQYLFSTQAYNSDYSEDVKKRLRDFNSPLTHWDTSQVTDMRGMFYYASSFNQPLASFDTSQVMGMGRMFSGASSFNQPLASFDTSQVTNMAYMFDGASSFNQPLASWDTSQVTYMQGMFKGALSFNQPLASFDTSQVTDMKGMFDEASSFNQPLKSWNVSRVEDFEDMFEGATEYQYGPLN